MFMFDYALRCRLCQGWLGNFVSRTHCPHCGCPVRTPLNNVLLVPVRDLRRTTVEDDKKRNPNLIETEDDPTIIAAGSVTLSAGLRPRRIVLRRLENQFTTHAEYMHVSVVTEDRDGVTYDVVRLTHESFDGGHYFSFGGATGVTASEAREAANRDFDQRR